jgi:4-amino-4-deoxy-L-arabinose transferase-like glycosyltransferase
MAQSRGGLQAAAARVPVWPFALFVLVALALWIGSSAYTNTALVPDVTEQFIWSKSLEWGYYKHPPLTTWIFAAVIASVGTHIWVPGLLSGICLAGTGWLTWAIAGRIVGRRAAFYCLLLWSLQQPFSLRAYIYNHNVPLVLFSALTVWAVIEATLRPARTWPWIFAGIAGGLAMMTKYQAAVPIIGTVWALWRSGALGQPAVRRGLGIAAAAGAALCVPHVVWLFLNDAPSLHYVAATRIESFGPADRLGGLVKFTVLQLRTIWMALLCGLLWFALARRSRGPALMDDTGAMDAASQRAWVEGLVLLPLAVVCSIALLGGMRLQGQWGMQTLQFVSIALVAWAMPRWRWPALRKALPLALALHVAGVALVTVEGLKEARSTELTGHVIQFGQGQVIADAIDRDWSRSTSCPLRYVVGDAHLAGLVAAYSPEHPSVLEDGEYWKNPWITPIQMRQAGSVYIAASADLLPPSAIHTPEMTLPALVWRREMNLVWGIVPPRGDCSVSQARAGP